MIAPRISAAMIMRDEEAFLDGCLRSIRNEVDEIVIADTGSRDRSKEIAVAWGARVLDYPWENDFSAARNHSLDAATGDWILYIDADERLEVPQPGWLRRSIGRAPQSAAFLMSFQPRNCFTTYLEGRLFRHDPRVRFTGRIHERIWPGVETVCAADNLSVGRSAARIVHVGYEGDLTRKHHRNLPLLERAVREDPARVYCWWHLGDTLAALGRPEEAETALRTAIEVASRSKNASERFEAVLAYQTLARIALAADADPLPIIEEGLNLLPQDHALMFIKARALINNRQYESALELLNGLTAQNPTYFADSYLAYDRRIFGEFAFDLKGVALLRLGRFAEASAAFEQAMASAPEQERMRYRAKAAAAKAKAPAREDSVLA